MKIAIYHPGLNIFGGGETVALAIASFLSKKYNVDILTPYEVSKTDLENFFNLDLSKVNIKRFGRFISTLPSIRSYKNSLYLKISYKKLEKYDLVIDTYTSGWFSKKLKTKTICYVHFPYFQPKKSGWKKFTNFLLVKPEKAFQYDRIICNSEFTKRTVQKLTDKPIDVVYPPVKIKSSLKKKKDIIITIGRFTYEKKHEVMIEAFKRLCHHIDDWEFHIVGSFRGDSLLYKIEYFNKIKQIVKGFPIVFHENIPNDKVLDLLSQSKIYWHARGYGEEGLNEYENFGITTVEAMGAGCVPIVINLGAQPEIVDHKINGFCWNEPKELIEYTQKIIDDPRLMDKLSKKAREKSLKYDISIFREKILRIVESLI